MMHNSAPYTQPLEHREPLQPVGGRAAAPRITTLGVHAAAASRGLRSLIRRAPDGIRLCTDGLGELLPIVDGSALLRLVEPVRCLEVLDIRLGLGLGMGLVVEVG